MKFTGAKIKEQGVVFAVVLVKDYATHNSTSEMNKTIDAFQPCFPNIPLVIASQNTRGTFTYYGRNDLVKFLASLPDPVGQIPWMEYTFQEVAPLVRPEPYEPNLGQKKEPNDRPKPQDDLDAERKPMNPRPESLEENDLS